MNAQGLVLKYRNMKMIKTKAFTTTKNELAEINPFIITHNCTYRYVDIELTDLLKAAKSE